ncbi:hypothetical protein SDC9_111230 [bioreactor metagenome]|uniref:Uncharacterized protein n=1 Tax=bioreactor metagenome TaxID=1076179 RepID=A0A645BR93_9ZZZZ
MEFQRIEKHKQVCYIDRDKLYVEDKNYLYVFPLLDKQNLAASRYSVFAKIEMQKKVSKSA